MDEIKVNDKVETAVFVCGKRQPTGIGIVTRLLSAGCCEVDIGSLHGCAPWLRYESTGLLNKVPSNRQ